MTMALTALPSFIAVWLRLRTGSVLLPILLHNFGNSVSLFAHPFARRNLDFGLARIFWWQMEALLDRATKRERIDGQSVALSRFPTPDARSRRHDCFGQPDVAAKGARRVG